ncbi:MAG: urate hydroxylase PuuD [Methylacidiphilales bacterium]|nr:urate hydroxylase PuuD [Candidatus Methylacidiphilales bacterium]
MNPLKTITGTLVVGFILAIIISFLSGKQEIALNTLSLVVWLHVFFGIIWIGLLYYFNFVQVPALAEAASDTNGPGGKGITKYLAPRALLWFRWGAVATWLTGAIAIELLFGNGKIIDIFFKFSSPVMSIGAWLGTIMLFNVWVFIWPNQKKVLGIVEATDEEKNKARMVAFYASRTNAILSIPMILSMVSYGHGGYIFY